MQKPTEKTEEKSQWRQFCDQEYKEQDLYEFDQMLRRLGYQSRKTSWRGIEYDFFNIHQFLVDKGAIKTREHLGHQVDHAVEGDGKFMLEALQNKIDQWRRWRDRKEWGRQQSAVELERLVASVSAGSRIEHTETD